MIFGIYSTSQSLLKNRHGTTEKTFLQISDSDTDFGTLGVFTVPPHSTWIPYGIHQILQIPYGFHPFHMEWFWVKFQPFCGFRSTWIPHGIHVERLWNHRITGLALSHYLII
jgi:hypothetical protein